ncbi:MAG: nuclear transport factor 2 family protein [Bacteroidota bacterium]
MKNINITLAFFLILICQLSACTQEKKSTMTSEQIVQQNLDAYNNRNIETFMSHFSDDIQLFAFGNPIPTADSKAKVKAIYQNLFEQSPELFSKIKKRIVFKNKVIDHEVISGRMGKKAPVEMVLIYEVEDGKIIKITAIK